MQQDQHSEATPQPRTQDRPNAEQIAASIKELIEGQKVSAATEAFARLRPADQADVVSRLSHDEQRALLGEMQPAGLGVLIEALGPERAASLSLDMDADQLSQVLDETSPPAAADLLRALPVEVANSTLERMEVAEEVAPLLEYDDHDAGGLMTPEFVAIRDTMTVTQAMDMIRNWAGQTQHAPEDIHFIFVVDYRDVPKGGLSLAQLVLAEPDQRVVQLMDWELISVADDTDQEQAARLMERYNIHRLPVVNRSNVLVGVLKLENMVDVLEEEATEDMYRMVGVGEEEKALGPFWRSVRSRLPWLIVNLGTAMLANLVVAGFSGVVVPLGMRAMRLDPALSSAVAVTTMTDVIGFLVYLGLASAVITYLVA